MATSELEERVTLLETEVTRLKQSLAQNGSDARPWWERIAGSFADAPDFEQAVQFGREYRESLRPDIEGHE
ncbi:MAG TPA: hypothetical protein VE821_04495 [Pyrinomonadaceae bacterium]|nr:hypothetical protein [Pyrinomonadaceae bacterium]